MNNRSRRRLIVCAVPSGVALAAVAAVGIGSGMAANPPLRTAAPLAGAGSITPATPGTTSTVVAGATNLGTAPAGEHLTVTLALPLRHKSALNYLFRDEYTPGYPTYHHYLTPSEFDARFAPTQASVTRIRSWAANMGIDVASVSSNRTLVQLSGTTSSIGTAFGTSFDTYRVKGGLTYLTPSSTAILPAALVGQVTSVVGMSTLGRLGVTTAPSDSTAPSDGTASSASSGGLLGGLLGDLFGGGASTPAPGQAPGNPVTTGTPAAPSYGPRQLASIYNAPTADQGAGQIIADIVEGSLTQVTKDLSTFETNNNLPHIPVTVVTVGAKSSDTSSQIEWDLDTQYSTGLAPQASRLILYDAHSLSDTDVLAAINSFVTQDKAKEAGLSGGECESVAAADGVMGATDNALAQAVAQGQTLFVATGDDGAFCEALQDVGLAGAGKEPPSISYPASSRYAVAVGGTTILTTDPLTEAAWIDSGGGVSAFELEPPYQLGLVGNVGGRATPDVAFDASPNTGDQVVVNGQTETVAGTSAATQAWVGIWARAQEAKGGNLGFANMAIYAAPPSVFHDITTGNNGFYLAGSGYSEVTGRGTPNIAAFIAGL